MRESQKRVRYRWLRLLRWLRWLRWVKAFNLKVTCGERELNVYKPLNCRKLWQTSPKPTSPST